MCSRLVKGRLLFLDANFRYELLELIELDELDELGELYTAPAHAFAP